MSTPIPRERGQRGRDVQHELRARAVAEGRLAADIAEALADPALSRWRAANGFAVVDDLTALAGPATGTVRVPADLVRDQVPAEVDLADPRAVTELYRTVLADGTAAQQAALLNVSVLKSLWTTGLAEAPVMRVWEQRFPQLAGR
ncbi:hypothetical protein AB0F20_10180 [Streptomyces goshikiensis]|uniref:hypothetical protein n=1 Tax=Streptomyces goshikiensis TaxID=1942 RepID=UPI0033C9CBB3